MAKTLHNDVFDAALDYLADNGMKINLCSAEPTTYAEANATYMLAQKALTVGDGAGDYVIGDGDVSGRKIAVGAQTGVTVTNTGTGTHLAITDTDNSKLLLVVSLSANRAVTSGESITIATFDLELTDPT